MHNVFSTYGEDTNQSLWINVNRTKKKKSLNNWVQKMCSRRRATQSAWASVKNKDTKKNAWLAIASVPP